jgi:AcrR family transcriptional regulator
MNDTEGASASQVIIRETSDEGAGVVGSSEAAAPVRATRKDAARNHDALLAAAGEVYAEKGVDSALEEIARRAGLGIGTLYRHFPTRNELTEAVYRREVEGLCASAEGLLENHAPVDALAVWMRSFAGYVAKKRGMSMALKTSLGPDNELFSYSYRRIREAIGLLVDRAVASGAIRDDVEAEDLLRAMSGICMAADSPGWADRTGRLIDLLVDGLRYGAPTPA